MNPQDEQRFASAILPLTKEDFWKKRVLDAGCGEGRNSFWAVRWGAREVVAFDEDPRAVEKASRLLNQFGNARAGTGSFYNNAYASEFDMVFSLGSIGYLAEPALAVKALARTAKPGALVLISLPSKEGSPWFARIIDRTRFRSLPLWSKEAVEGLFDRDIYREVHLFPSSGGLDWTAIGVTKE